MALSVNVGWEVRTTGSNNNGGGFVKGAAGTDYSQQDAAQFSGTDLASISSLVVASVSHNFVSTDVGNLIQITAGTGFTAGFYQIVSVSSNQATLDRSPGTVGVGGTWAEGGGLSTIAAAVAAMVPSNTIWIKSGTYTLTATQTLASGQQGNAASPSIIWGYQTTHGDATGTRPLITTSTNSVNLLTLTSSSYWAFRNLSLSNTASTRGHGITTPTSGGGTIFNVMVDNCLLNGFDYGLYFDNSPVYGCQGLVVTNTEIKSCTSIGVVNTYETTLVNCYIHGCTGAAFGPGAFATSGTTYIAIGCVFYLNAYGWDSNAYGNQAMMLVFVDCVFSDNTADGIRLQNADPMVFITVLNCIFYNNTGYGVNNPNTTNSGYLGSSVQGNAYGANGTAPVLNFAAANVSLGGDPFVARTSGNFALNNTSGAGAACRGTGYPGVGIAGTGYGDIGALQHQDSGGGSTTIVVAPTINNYIQE